MAGNLTGSLVILFEPNWSLNPYLIGIISTPYIDAARGRSVTILVPTAISFLATIPRPFPSTSTICTSSAASPVIASFRICKSTNFFSSGVFSASFGSGCFPKIYSLSFRQDFKYITDSRTGPQPLGVKDSRLGPKILGPQFAITMKITLVLRFWLFSRFLSWFLLLLFLWRHFFNSTFWFL